MLWNNTFLRHAAFELHRYRRKREDDLDEKSKPLSFPNVWEPLKNALQNAVAVELAQVLQDIRCQLKFYKTSEEDVEGV